MKGRTVRAQFMDADMYAAIDGVTDKLHQQLTRIKERTRDHKRGEDPEAIVSDAESIMPASLDGDDDDGGRDEPRIVRTKQFLDEADVLG